MALIIGEHILAGYNTGMSSSPDIHVRCACSEGSPAIKIILYETFASTWLPHLTSAAAETYKRQDRPTAYINEQAILSWVAEQDGGVVGFVGLEGNFVNALHVRPSRARMGVGSRLMDKVEAEISAEGFAAVRPETDTFNVPSLTFYIGRGYREVDRYPDTEWGSGLTTVLLEKLFT